MYGPARSPHRCRGWLRAERLHDSARSTRSRRPDRRLTSLIRHDYSLYASLSLATELLTADVPVAAMALSEMGPPGEILGGFSFFGRGWRHRRCPSLFRVDAQAFPRPATTGQQPPCRRCARNAKRPVHHACGKGGKAIANVLRSTSGIASTNRRMRSMSLRSSE